MVKKLAVFLFYIFVGFTCFETYFATYIGPCGAEGTKTTSVIAIQIPFNLGVLRVGGHRRPSLSNFYNGVKKLAQFDSANFFVNFDLFYQCL